MGEYAPDDQRMIHRNSGPEQPMSNWQEREKQQQQQGEAQPGYGNARNTDGEMEQEGARDGQQDASSGQASTTQPGEISDRPDERAAADADRPLGSS